MDIGILDEPTENGSKLVFLELKGIIIFNFYVVIWFAFAICDLLSPERRRQKCE